MKTLLTFSGAFLLLILISIAVNSAATACTRVVYQGPDDLVITARSMDWEDEIGTNLWIFPRGMKRSGMAPPNSVEWTSKYGSLIASGYDISSSDGMNEKGLVANLLWLVESEYPEWNAGKNKPGLSIAAWVQYVLDNFATVDEAVTELSKENFMIVTSSVPGADFKATCHLSISDASGDNAIFEYVNGKLNVHHSRSYTVMTNSPTFEKQLALESYWREISGTVFLPGTNRAADRFARASFYINAIPQTSDVKTAIASCFSVIRNCSVPLGISTPSQPNISSTRWRSVSDQKNKVYYFETATTPNTFWVDFSDIDFSQNAPIKMLGLTKGQVYAGNAASSFVVSEPFVFEGL